MELTDIKSRLEARFPEANIVVEDFGGGNHIHVIVASSEFAGKSLIEQHQMINALFAEEMKTEEIHALKITSKVM